MIYRFAECELDTNLYTLQRGGKTIRLRPKVFRVCLCLLEHRDRVVTREELCAQVWPEQFISQATLEGVIRTVRQVVGDNGQTQCVIQTLHGYGYRFVASVDERPSKSMGGPAPLGSMHLAPPEMPPLGQIEGDAASVATTQEKEATFDDERPSEASHGVAGWSGHGTDSHAAVVGGERQAARRRSSTWWRISRGGMALAIGILLVVGGWVFWQGVRERPARPLDKSRVAVLPFIDLSAEGDSAYFADGMTEELIAQLSQVYGLTVIARTSVMKYKGTLKDAATIGRELRVGTILEGSVRRVDNHVRISAQLIDVATQSYLWSQEYDRELTGVFGIQSDIATRVAQQLKVQLSAGEKRRIEEPGTENLEAYTLYLQGRYFRNQWNEGGLRKAIEYFERAAASDPRYALAFAGMADAYLLLPFFSATTRPLEVFPRALAAVERALQQGEALAPVHTTLASAKLWYAWDWAGAEVAFKHALALSPNDAGTHRRYAWYLITRGRLPDAIAVMHWAQELNPLSPGITRSVGQVFYWARQYDQAIAYFRKALAMDPNVRTAYSGLVYASLQRGLAAEALAACQQMVDRWGRDPWTLWDLGYAFAMSGQRDQARQVLAELQAQAQHAYVKSLAFAWIAIGLDETEQALAWLEQAYAEREPYLTLINADPIYDRLRADPRFIALVQKIGLGK
jgi:TolB-like protein/DNA-binding winged helix-turn-helix (wHTH) protein/Tfp pilus assembly protein PilF